jgi:tmRNA-binding protein
LFLDVQLTRLHQGFDYQLFTKAGQTDRVLNYKSFHPQAVKSNLITNEIKRIEERTNNPNLTNKLKKTFTQTLTANGYPQGFIQKALNWKPKPKNEEIVAKTAIPYLGQPTQQIKRILQTQGIQTFFSNTPNCRRLATKNNPAPIQQKTDIVYKIPCMECEKFYIGQTKQRFEQRAKQHQAAIRKADPENALANHFNSTQHLPEWEAASIVFHEPNQTRRLILETATIEAHKPQTTNLTSGPYRSVIQLIPTQFHWPEGATRQGATGRGNEKQEEEVQGKQRARTTFKTC